MSSIYREIETHKCHTDCGGKSVFVGLYFSNDMKSHTKLCFVCNFLFACYVGELKGEISLTYTDFNAINPQFTITCISTGGSATTVTWERNSVIVKENSSYTMNTVFVDRVTAQYNHALNVTGRLGGLYQCIVGNNQPSETVMSLEIFGKHCTDLCERLHCANVIVAMVTCMCHNNFHSLVYVFNIYIIVTTLSTTHYLA